MPYLNISTNTNTVVVENHNTSSIQFTANNASYCITASHIQSASYAETASYALNGGGSPVTWPLVSDDGNLSLGSSEGTQAYIDDSGNAFFQTSFAEGVSNAADFQDQNGNSFETLFNGNGGFVAQSGFSINAGNAQSSQVASGITTGTSFHDANNNAGSSSQVLTVDPSTGNSLWQSIPFPSSVNTIRSGSGIIVSGSNPTLTISVNAGNVPTIQDVTAASAGCVGEYRSTTVGGRTGIALTNSATSASNAIGFVSLTPGTWIVDGYIDFVGTSATVTNMVACIGPTSGVLNMSTNVIVDAQSALQTVTSSFVQSVTCHPTLVTIASGSFPVFYYLNARATFSAGTMTARGGMVARRL